MISSPSLRCFLTIAVMLLAVVVRGEEPTYEVYALSYGVIPDFPVSSLIESADRARRLNIQMTVWLLKGSDGRNVLVDSGFYRDRQVQRWKVRDFVKPSDAVGRLGLKAEDISDIVVTHMHWDHAGSLDLFPKARVWIQKDEYGYYTGEAWQANNTHGGIEPDDVQTIVKLNTEGRVRLVTGDGQGGIPGLTFYTGGRHTYASQFVSVRLKEGTAVIASDNLYLYENLEKHVPIAQTLDRESNLRAQERMKQIASDVRLIVPGHDPTVFVRFPKPGAGVARIE